MDRDNHYEAAFAAFLHARRVCHVAVDEARRSPDPDDFGTLKSPDFLVYTAAGPHLLVDVKGRRFPGGTADRPRRVWENWATRGDLDGLARWADYLGPGHVGLLVFAYKMAAGLSLPAGTPDAYEFRGELYLFRAVAAAEYAEHARVRSRSWDTVCLPTAAFRKLVRPVSAHLHCPRAAALIH